MSLTDLAKFEATPLETDPYEFAVVPGFVSGERAIKSTLDRRRRAAGAG